MNRTKDGTPTRVENFADRTPDTMTSPANKMIELVFAIASTLIHPHFIITYSDN